MGWGTFDRLRIECWKALPNAVQAKLGRYKWESSALTLYLNILQWQQVINHLCRFIIFLDALSTREEWAFWHRVLDTHSPRAQQWKIIPVLRSYIRGTTIISVELIFWLEHCPHAVVKQYDVCIDNGIEPPPAAFIGASNPTSSATRGGKFVSQLLAFVDIFELSRVQNTMFAVHMNGVQFLIEIFRTHSKPWIWKLMKARKNFLRPI